MLRRINFNSIIKWFPLDLVQATTRAAFVEFFFFSLSQDVPLSEFGGTKPPLTFPPGTKRVSVSAGPGVEELSQWEAYKTFCGHWLTSRGRILKPSYARC